MAPAVRVPGEAEEPERLRASDAVVDVGSPVMRLQRDRDDGEPRDVVDAVARAAARQHAVGVLR